MTQRKAIEIAKQSKMIQPKQFCPIIKDDCRADCVSWNARIIKTCNGWDVAYPECTNTVLIPFVKLENDNDGWG